MNIFWKTHLGIVFALILAHCRQFQARHWEPAEKEALFRSLSCCCSELSGSTRSRWKLRRSPDFICGRDKLGGKWRRDDEGRRHCGHPNHDPPALDAPQCWPGCLTDQHACNVSRSITIFAIRITFFFFADIMVSNLSLSLSSQDSSFLFSLIACVLRVQHFYF